MSEIIKVLLADDSSVVRRLVSSTLNKDASIEVVQTACHGAEAVGYFTQIRPDVVILDVEMPTMDGVDAAAAIRSMDATVPIIMFSSLTTKGGEATLDALTKGASDYVTKPTGTGHASEAIRHIQTQLIPKVLSWGGKRRAATNPVASVPGPGPGKVASLAKSPSAPIEIVAIGSSTGGPNVLNDFVKEFPADFPLPVLIVQHMPPVFTRLLAERLDHSCKLKVREAVDGENLVAGHVWVAPGDKHLKVLKGRTTPPRIILGSEPPENSCRPAVDVLFRSVVDCYGAGTLGVVVTGMGKDGLLGCEQIKKCGGRVFVQDEQSSVVWGMPGAVANAGLADSVLPPVEIAQEIIRLAKTRQMASVSN